MTDTPTIALYYKEHDPMKRKMFLDQSIAAGEDEETNAVRKEIWEIRYGGPSELGPDTRADGYLALWMAMEYSKDAAGRMPESKPEHGLYLGGEGNYRTVTGGREQCRRVRGHIYPEVVDGGGGRAYSRIECQPLTFRVKI